MLIPLPPHHAAPQPFQPYLSPLPALLCAPHSPMFHQLQYENAFTVNIFLPLFLCSYPPQVWTCLGNLCVLEVLKAMCHSITSWTPTGGPSLIKPVCGVHDGTAHAGDMRFIFTLFLYSQYVRVCHSYCLSLCTCGKIGRGR